MNSEQRQLDEFLPQSAGCREVDAVNTKARSGVRVDRGVVDENGALRVDGVNFEMNRTAPKSFLRNRISLEDEFSRGFV